MIGSVRRSAAARPDVEKKKEDLSWMRSEKEAETLTDQQRSDLKRLYNGNRKSAGLPVAKLEWLLNKAKIDIRESERKRMAKVASIVDDDNMLSWEQVLTFAMKAVDVNMLRCLFVQANTDTKYEKVENFLDLREVKELYDSIGVEVSAAQLEKVVDELDRDSDGKVDWEEFLTLSEKLLGAMVIVAIKNEETKDNSEFNQLRSGVRGFKERLLDSRRVIIEIDKQIQGKQKEIAKRVKDTSLEDTRAKLKAAWDAKDKMEEVVLNSTTKFFEMIENVLKENDVEKKQLVERFQETCAQRDAERHELYRMRTAFRQKFEGRFDEYNRTLGEMGQIQEMVKQLEHVLRSASAQRQQLGQVRTKMGKKESIPVVTASDRTIEFVQSQQSVIDQIMTRMQLMQRERDKYEDMIEDEMEANKKLRIKTIKAELATEMLETKLVNLEKNLKDEKLQQKSLLYEAAKVQEGVPDRRTMGLLHNVKKLRQMKEQHTHKHEQQRKTIEEQKVKIERAERMGKQLQIELGELKLMLDSLQESHEEIESQGLKHERKAQAKARKKASRRKPAPQATDGFESSSSSSSEEESLFSRIKKIPAAARKQK